MEESLTYQISCPTTAGDLLVVVQRLNADAIGPIMTPLYYQIAKVTSLPQRYLLGLSLALLDFNGTAHICLVVVVSESPESRYDQGTGQWPDRAEPKFSPSTPNA